MSDTSFEIPQKFEFTVTQAEQTALDLLAEGTGLSKQRIKDAMNKGAVWWTLKGKTLRLRRATKVLYKGSKIQFFYDEQVLARKPESAKLIYDSGNYEPLLDQAMEKIGYQKFINDLHKIWICCDIIENAILRFSV